MVAALGVVAVVAIAAAAAEVAVAVAAAAGDEGDAVGKKKRCPKSIQHIFYTPFLLSHK